MSKFDELIERAHEKHSMPLSDFIESEDLYTYELGMEDILEADFLNVAIVPCREYLILVRERFNEEDKAIVAEYAIYSQHDHDGRTLKNSLNMNAIYELEYVGDQQFENMAFAIAWAADLVHHLTCPDHSKHLFDPIDDKEE